MSLTRTSMTFFQNNKPLSTKLYDAFIWAYEHSPINFSTLTGIHHPDVSRLTGNPFLGRLQHASGDNGKKLEEEMNILAEIALKDKRGIAYCSYGNIPVMLFANPTYVAQVAIFNDGNTDKAELLGPFNHIFDEKNVFGMAVSEEWRIKRETFRKWIFDDKALDNVTEKMQMIIDEYLTKIESKDGKIPSVEKFMVALTMDLFTRSILDTPSLEDKVEKISSGFGSALLSSTNLQNVVLLKLSAVASYFHLKTTQKLDKERISLQSIITKNFLEPNYETLKETHTILQKYFQESKDKQTSLTNAYADTAILLLAGHETTSRLLQFTLMHLAKDEDIVKKIRKEIENNRPANNQWTREDLNKMTYLKKVLKESLRLHPPVPIIPRVATNTFIISDIPLCKTKTEYEHAFANRDTTKDIIISKGTLLAISPLVTHRMAECYDVLTNKMTTIYKDPLAFNPDRFTSDEIFISRNQDSKNENPYAWFPFGLGRRDCPGRKIAIQEALLTLIKLVDKFDFNVAVTNETDQLFQTYIQGTLKHKGEVSAEFKARTPGACN